MNFVSVLITLIKLESNSDKTLDVAHTKYSWHIVTRQSTEKLRGIWNFYCPKVREPCSIGSWKTELTIDVENRRPADVLNKHAS